MTTINFMFINQNSICSVGKHWLENNRETNTLFGYLSIGDR